MRPFPRIVHEDCLKVMTKGFDLPLKEGNGYVTMDSLFMAWDAAQVCN